MYVNIGTLQCFYLRQGISLQTKSNHQADTDTASTKPEASSQAVRYTNTVKETTQNYINFEAGYEPVEYRKEDNEDTPAFDKVYELDGDGGQRCEDALEEGHYKVPRSIAKW